MIVCETPRLRLRHITVQDAQFILELLNEPDFIRNIGDRQIRTRPQVRADDPGTRCGPRNPLVCPGVTRPGLISELRGRAGRSTSRRRTTRPRAIRTRAV